MEDEIEIDFNSKTGVVFGLRGEGKSTLVNNIAEDWGKFCFVYDTLGEVPDGSSYDCYTPTSKHSVEELERVCKGVKKSHKYKLFILDESNRFCPPKPAQLPPEIEDLNDMCRHYPIGAIYIARRPSQLNSNLTEIANHVIIFHLKGDKDIQQLEDLSHGLGETVLHLPKYHFVYVNDRREYFVCSPVAPSENWLKGAKLHIAKGLN